jgi:HEAT repeat protein
MSDDLEVTRQIAALHIRAGSPPDLRQRGRALAWLVAHADRTLPLALVAAEAAPQDVALIDLLGHLRRSEATPLLTRAFGDERTRTYAATGLGMSPDPLARAVLRTALESSDSREVVAALGGLGSSGDPSACGGITPRLKSAHAEVRWMAVEAGCRLGCHSRAVLEDIAQNDPDADVRALAVRRLG